jgi:hypothetical protein
MKKRTVLTAIAAAGLAVGATFLEVETLEAADHAEAPGTQADAVADIADYYAWHTANDTIVNVITFAPFGTTTATGVYDADVLYGVHVDLDLDNVADSDMWFRFGQNAAGDWGVQATLVDALGTIVVEGAVETNITHEIVPTQDINLWAGAADDPFFFDATGFSDTLSTGTISFTTADAIAGLNVTSIVIETPAPLDSSTFQPITSFQTWATTSRL